jgi:hypothetical protein
MKRIGYHTLAALAGLTFAAAAFATPIPNSAVVHQRVWNDCPITVLNVTNNYPASIQIDDQNAVAPFCVGYANLNTWRFSTDGVNPIEFQNGDAFEYSCTLVLNGIGEGGLNLAPWWGPDADGLFNVRTTDGEIAVFGGRLPFYSFTGAHGLVYVNNTPIELKVTYQPNGLSAVSPATVVYEVRYNAVSYSSGPLAFDQGNAAEDPPHGQWGALNPWYAGGHMKTFMFPSGQPHGIVGTWSDITASTPPVATTGGSWGRLKLLYK